MDMMTQLGHTLMAGIALSLGLEESYFANRYTSDPLILFRIFNYPPNSSPTHNKDNWGVGEHTDYGVLTILKQDSNGGLQVKSKLGANFTIFFFPLAQCINPIYEFSDIVYQLNHK